jgi:hypothetical protein
VRFDDWHDHFASGEEALDWVGFAYSGQCRLAITYRGRLAVKWVVESFGDGQWIAEREFGHILVPFWLSPRIVYRQNPNLLAPR